MIKSANNCSSNSIVKHFKQGSLKSIAEIKEKYQNDKQGKKKKLNNERGREIWT